MMSEGEVLKLGVALHGLGITLILMGFGDDEDYFVVIFDGHFDGVQFVVFWRDVILADFS